MRVFILLVSAASLAAFPAPSTVAQESVRARSVLKVAFGTGEFQQRDVQASPLRYGGGAFGLELAYRRERGTTRRWLIRLEAWFPRAESAITRGDTHQERGFAARLSTVEMWPAGFQLPWDFAPSLGLRADLNAFYRDHEYSRGSAEPFLDAILWLGPSVSAARTWSAGWNLQADLSTALIAVVARTPYAGLKYNPTLKPTVLPSFFALATSVRASRALGDHFDLVLTYRLHLMRHEGAFLLSRAHHVLGIGIGFLPGGRQ